jgi:hypothetical protein
MGTRVTAVVLVAAAFAAYRAARLVTDDSLIEGWRATFMRWCFEPDGSYRLVEWLPARGARTWMTPALTTGRGKLGDLLSCPFCIGVWLSAGFVLLAWCLGYLPGGWICILWISAVAGGQATLQSINAALFTAAE